MQYDESQERSRVQMTAERAVERRPGEVDAHLLLTVSGVLIGTCLTVAAFLASTTAIAEGLSIQPRVASRALHVRPEAQTVAPSEIPPSAVPSVSIDPDCVGPACAGAATDPRSTQPS